ncbi:MAG: diguanylate cyclase [Phycisphaerae bacterium]|nr:diguanylate cyclase [Phycisphaerae bacterium]
MKIQIIDDSPEALAIARARLAPEGVNITTAQDGLTGIAMACEDKPDLILLDLDMPELDGFEVCRRLKGDAQTYMIPIIFLTASGDRANTVKGLDLGAVDYVTKPFEAYELQARVRAALRTKRLQDLLIQYAQIDPLTELGNRRALLERLGQSWARVQRGESLAFIMCDVDRFKRVNDEHGHLVGDRVLQAVADAIRVTCRQSDFPARYGGEEFAILVHGASHQEAMILADRCRMNIAQLQIPLRGSTISPTASFGVADSATANSSEELIRQADRALYHAKCTGRNRTCCTADTIDTATTLDNRNSRIQVA